MVTRCMSWLRSTRVARANESKMMADCMESEQERGVKKENKEKMCTLRRAGSWLENTRRRHVNANIAATAVKIRTTWNAASWATPNATSSSFVSVMRRHTENKGKGKREREKRSKLCTFLFFFFSLFFSLRSRLNNGRQAKMLFPNAFAMVKKYINNGSPPSSHPSSRGICVARRARAPYKRSASDSFFCASGEKPV